MKNRILSPELEKTVLGVFINHYDIFERKAQSDVNCINYLNEESFDKKALSLLKKFNGKPISHQTFIYGSSMDVECLNGNGNGNINRKKYNEILTLITDKGIHRINIKKNDFTFIKWKEIDKIVPYTDMLSCKQYTEPIWISIGSIYLTELSGKENTYKRMWRDMFNEVINAAHSDKHISVEKRIPQDFSHLQKKESGKTSANTIPAGSSKEIIEAKYNELILSLQEAQKTLNKIQGVNKETIELRQALLKSLNNQIGTVQKEAEYSLNSIAWDKLVIAFFGETNAGKSTIIETFRILFEKNRKANNDGVIVGDGRQDFTKDYHEYELYIEGHPFTLIDVPGIEGNESEFKDVIKKALGKAHCVFYVQGHNKKPDSATAKKIKTYLGDWVNVYSIQNVRGDVSFYDEEEERETLLTANVRKNEELIRKAFEDILGSIYKGNIPLQALLAMCAKASFSDKRQDLKKTQTKLLKYFNSAEEILTFSQFHTITNLVKEKSNNFIDEIAEANKQKMLSLAGRSISSIEEVFESNKESFQNIRSRLKDFRRDVLSIIGSTKNNINSKINNTIEDEFRSLSQSLFSIIDQGGDNVKSKAQENIRIFQRRLLAVIKDLVKSEIDKMKTKIDSKKKTLEGISLKNTFYTDMSTDLNIKIDVSEALEELDINLDDIGDFAVSVAGLAAVGAVIGSAIPVVGTAIGAGVGALVGLFKHVIQVDNGDHGTGAAKNETSKELEKAKEKVRTIMSNETRKINNKLDDLKTVLINNLDVELKNLDRLDKSIEDVNIKMSVYSKKIKSNGYGKI